MPVPASSLPVLANSLPKVHDFILLSRLRADHLLYTKGIGDWAKKRLLPFEAQDKRKAAATSETLHGNSYYSAVSAVFR